MTTTTIKLKNNDIYIIDVVKEPETSGIKTRYEVSCEDGIPTGETCLGGDNPTYSWSFPCDNEQDAIQYFIDGIERLRNEYGYDL